MLIAVVMLFAVHGAITLYLRHQLNAEVRRLRDSDESLSIDYEFRRTPVPFPENAAPLYLAARALIADIQVYRPSPRDEDPDPVVIREALARDEHATQLLMEASRRPQCQFDLNWAPGIDTQLFHLGPMRDLTHFLGHAARVAAEDGRIPQAYALMSAGFRMAKHVATEPCPTCLLHAYAVDSEMAKAASSVLAKGMPAGDGLRELTEALTSRDFWSEYTEALKGDRAIVYDFLKRRCGTPEGLRRIRHDCGRSAHLVSACPHLRLPFFYAGRLEYLRGMARLIRDAAEPARNGCAEEHLVQSLPWYCFLAKMALPESPCFRVCRDERIVMRAILQAAIELERCRNETGSYPRTLAALGADLGGHADIFSGQELVYRLDGDGFLLYSFGPDLDDDGGRPRWHQIRKDTDKFRPRYSAEGDIVWIPHGRKETFRQRWVGKWPKEPTYVKEAYVVGCPGRL